jgi:hypothetical protein
MPKGLLRVLTALALLLLTAPVPRAAPPENADPNLAPWFRSLRQPNTGISCCDRADCRAVQYRIVNGHYQAFIGGEFSRWQNPPYQWMDVPDSSVLHRHDNPTGEGVACWAGGAIICFIEGNGT